MNVSNLLLARSQARRKEIAIRLALGGSRMRLTRQLLTESLVLSLAAAAFGLLLTQWAIQALPALLPPMPMRFLPEISPDMRVVGFAIGLAFLTTLIFALIPALHASRLNVVSLLTEAPGTGQSGRRYLGRNALVVGQLCISLVLLTQSGLLIKSLLRGLQSDVGFEKKNMLLAQFVLDTYSYDEQPGTRLLSDLAGTRPGISRRKAGKPREAHSTQHVRGRARPAGIFSRRTGPSEHQVQHGGPELFPDHGHAHIAGTGFHVVGFRIECKGGARQRGIQQALLAQGRRSREGHTYG